MFHTIFVARIVRFSQCKHNEGFLNTLIEYLSFSSKFLSVLAKNGKKWCKSLKKCISINWHNDWHNIFFNQLEKLFRLIDTCHINDGPSMPLAASLSVNWLKLSNLSMDSLTKAAFTVTCQMSLFSDCQRELSTYPVPYLSLELSEQFANTTL